MQAEGWTASLALPAFATLAPLQRCCKERLGPQQGHRSITTSLRLLFKSVQGGTIPKWSKMSNTFFKCKLFNFIKIGRWTSPRWPFAGRVLRISSKCKNTCSRCPSKTTWTKMNNVFLHVGMVTPSNWVVIQLQQFGTWAYGALSSTNRQLINVQLLQEYFSPKVKWGGDAFCVKKVSPSERTWQREQRADIRVWCECQSMPVFLMVWPAVCHRGYDICQPDCWDCTFLSDTCAWSCTSVHVLDSFR